MKNIFGILAILLCISVYSNFGCDEKNYLVRVLGDSNNSYSKSDFIYLVFRDPLRNGHRLKLYAKEQLGGFSKLFNKEKYITVKYDFLKSTPEISKTSYLFVKLDSEEIKVGSHYELFYSIGKNSKAKVLLSGEIGVKSYVFKIEKEKEKVSNQNSEIKSLSLSCVPTGNGLNSLRVNGEMEFLGPFLIQSKNTNDQFFTSIYWKVRDFKNLTDVYGGKYGFINTPCQTNVFLSEGKNFIKIIPLKNFEKGTDISSVPEVEVSCKNWGRLY